MRFIQCRHNADTQINNLLKDTSSVHEIKEPIPTTAKNHVVRMCDLIPCEKQHQQPFSIACHSFDEAGDLTWSACPCSSELRTSTSACGSTLLLTAPPAACGCFASMLAHSDSAEAAICRSESPMRLDSSPTIASIPEGSNWAL
jgi:hypothetical protein